MIAPSEYRERQAKIAELGQRQGHRAVLVWGRGGATQDRFADLFYFSGYYPQQPFVPDRPGHWRAQGHAALLIPIHGPAILVSDAIEFQDLTPVADQFESDADVVAKVISLIGRLVPPGTIALIGCDALTFGWKRDLMAGLAHHRLVEADSLSIQLRSHKTEAELQLLREAARLGAHAVRSAMQTVEPGVRESEIAAVAIAEITRAGGAFYGMGLSSGVWAHTFGPSLPSGFTTRQVNAGDLVRLDIYGSLNGYMFDLGRSCLAGDSPSVVQELMMGAVRDAVLAGIAAIRPGKTLGDIARRCEDTLVRSAFTARYGHSRETMGGAWGHGVGITFEEPWIDAESEVVIEPGLCLALERRISMPGLGGANYEDVVILTEAGVEVLTASADQR